MVKRKWSSSYGSGSKRRKASFARRKNYRAAWYAGRGARPGPRMYRKFRGLRSYPDSGIETKFFDTSFSAGALLAPTASATWAGMELVPTGDLAFNTPVQGSGASDREGRFITMQSLQITGMIAMAPQIDQTAADSAPTIKLWVVLDTQTNGGTATGCDSELVYTNPVATSIGGVQPLRNMLYSKRFKVLKEICIQVPQVSISYDGTNIEQEGLAVPFDAFVPLKGLKTEYLGNAGTVADIVTNGLFLLGCTSSTNLGPSLTYNARLRFRG